jgi:hypothetical protein
LLYLVLATLLVGIVKQADYNSLVTSIQDAGKSVFQGHVNKLTESGVLLMVAIGGGLSQPLDQSQQINVILLGLFTWLVVVWLLRQFMAGNTVKLRDGLYNGGAPFLSTLCILIILSIQLLPGALGVIVYTAANSTGAITGGAEAMAFAIAAGLLVILSLYWVTSTFLAAVIVTLPGTYPLRAMKSAGDLAFGKRSSLVLRLLWLAFMVILLWAVILIPSLLLDNWLHISWLPLVPIVVQLLGGLTIIYASSYTYVLYRKMIDGDA